MKRMLRVCLLVFGLILSWTLAYAADLYVIPVKKCCTCKGTLHGTRWCDNGDGTVTDMTTCLVWLKYADWGKQWPWRSYISANYDDAHTRAGLLAHGATIHQGVYDVKLFDGSTVGDWRLPTETELDGIVHEPEAVYSTEMRAFSTGRKSDRLFPGASLQRSGETGGG